MRKGILLLVVLLCLPACAAGAVTPAWTTYRHDAARSGVDPDSTSPMAPSLAWQTSSGVLDGSVWAEPLVYGANLYVATENDTIYALSAASGAVVWSRHLGTPEDSDPSDPHHQAPCGDIAPTLGITGTPVIDPATNRIYAVGAVGGSSGPVSHQLFALDASTGAAAPGFPISADPPKGSPADMLQRPALALQGSRILVGYGGNDGDCNKYWGWLVSLPTTPPGAELTFQADSMGNDHGGAIWGGGSGPPLDAAGHAWVATGNGYSGSTFDYAESVISFDAGLNRVGFWAPTDWSTLDGSDQDIGSSEPTLIGSDFVFQAGKDNNAYLINAAKPGAVSKPAAERLGFCSGQSFGGDVYFAATSTIYAPCTDGLKALTLGGTSMAPTLTVRPDFAAPNDANGPPIIAGGLVWVTAWNSRKLYGLNPATGAATYQYPLSEVEHFAIPSAGGGRLFLGAGSQVLAFTIAKPPTGEGGGNGGGGANKGGPPPASVPPRLTHLRLASARVRSGHILVVGMTSDRATTVTITIVHRRRHPGRAVLRRTVRLHFSGRHRARLRLSGVSAGRYTVDVSLRGGGPVALGLQVLPAR